MCSKNCDKDERFRRIVWKFRASNYDEDMEITDLRLTEGRGRNVVSAGESVRFEPALMEA